MDKVKPIKVERVAPRVPQVGKRSSVKKPTEFAMVPTEPPAQVLETREIIQEAKKKEAEVLEAREVVQNVDKKVTKKRVAKSKSTTIAKLDGASVSAEAIGNLVRDLPAGEGIKYKIVAIRPI